MNDFLQVVTSTAAGRARLRELKRHTKAQDCPKCGQPGVYTRTRDLERCRAEVWMCQNKKCVWWNLYWYPDGGITAPRKWPRGHKRPRESCHDPVTNSKRPLRNP